MVGTRSHCLVRICWCMVVIDVYCSYMVSFKWRLVLLCFYSHVHILADILEYNSSYAQHIIDICYSVIVLVCLLLALWQWEMCYTCALISYRRRSGPVFVSHSYLCLVEVLDTRLCVYSCRWHVFSAAEWVPYEGLFNITTDKSWQFSINITHVWMHKLVSSNYNSIYIYEYKYSSIYYSSICILLYIIYSIISFTMKVFTHHKNKYFLIKRRYTLQVSTICLWSYNPTHYNFNVFKPILTWRLLIYLVAVFQEYNIIIIWYV